MNLQVRFWLIIYQILTSTAWCAAGIWYIPDTPSLETSQARLDWVLTNLI